MIVHNLLDSGLPDDDTNKISSRYRQLSPPGSRQHFSHLDRSAHRGHRCLPLTSREGASRSSVFAPTQRWSTRNVMGA